MKVLAVVFCLAMLTRASFALPMDGNRGDVISKLQDVLAELQGEEQAKVKYDGADLLEPIDISDMDLDQFQESGDEFILDSDKTKDLLEEFRQAMANQGEVADDEKDDVILLKSQSMARPELEEDDEDDDEETTGENEVATRDSSKYDGADLLEEIDISDMDLDQFQESGDEFILDTDKTRDLLEEFRQAMANQGEVADDEKDEVIPLKSEVNIQATQDNDEDEDEDDKANSKYDGADLLEPIDISDMDLDQFQENGDEFILDSDKTRDLLEEFRQAMANQGEVADDEKDEVIPLKSEVNIQATQEDDDDDDKANSKYDGADLLEEIDISDMDLDKFKESGDEFILDSDKTRDLLEEFRQAMANQGEVAEDEKDDVIPLKSEVNIQDSKEEDTPNDSDEDDDMSSLEDDEVTGLNLDTMEPASRSETRISDFEENSDETEKAYPESPDSFVSEVLSDLNSEE